MSFIIDTEKINHNVELHTTEYQVVVQRRVDGEEPSTLEVIGHYYERGNMREADMNEERLAEWVHQGATFADDLPRIIVTVAEKHLSR